MRLTKKLLSVLLAVCMLATMLVITTQPTAFAGNFCNTTCGSASVDKSKSSTVDVNCSYTWTTSAYLYGGNRTISPTNYGCTCNGQTGSQQNAGSGNSSGYTITFRFNVSSWAVGSYTAESSIRVAVVGFDSVNESSTANGTITVTCSHSGNKNGTQTCTTSQTCAACGAVTASALGHSYTSTSTDSTHLKSGATCTAAAVYYKSCSRCGANGTETFTSGSSLGHNYSSSVTTAPGCTTTGVRTYTCSRCNNSYTESIAATGHTPGAAATCTTAQTCTVCGATITPATGHTPGAAATCTTAQTCTVCGATITPATGHTPGAAATCTTAQTCTRCGATLADALGHDYNAVVTAPTCTAGGYTSHTCSRCGDTYTDNATSALGHNWDTGTVTPATCTTDGYTTYNCTRCDESYIDDEVAALGHDYVGTVTTAPGCTTAGVMTYNCSRCDSSYTETIAATGHTVVEDAAVPATCTAAGMTAGSHCSVCGTVLVAQETVAALGHNYETEVTAPTCTTAGYTTYTCSRCGDTYTDDEVAATGHDVDGVEWTVVTPATCTATGLKVKYCSVCGEIAESETIALAPHTWDEGEITTAPDCTNAGEKTYTCTVCGATDTEVVPATGHNYEASVTEPTCTEGGYTTYTCANCGDTYTDDATEALGHTVVEDAAVPATCTAAGMTAGSHCSACGTVLVAQEVVAPLGHNYETEVTAPTCTTAGYTTYTCSRCGDTYTADEVAATGHDVDGVEWTVVTPATCTATGTKVKYCTVCGEIAESETIALAPHTWDEGEITTSPDCTTAGEKTYTCSVCGATDTEVVPATGHNYEASVTEPTCTEGGYTTYTCANCGDTYTDDATEALGHTVVEDAAVPATCTETGLTAGSHCSACGTVLVAQEVVPVTGHSFDEGIITTAPNCTETGIKTYTCSVCGATDTEVVPATGHTAGERAVETVEGTEKYVTRCTVCDAVISVEDIDSADYSAVNAAIAAANALVATEYYDLSAVTAAVAAVETGLNAEHQEDVDAMAAAINEAIDALVPLANYFRLVDGTVATVSGTTITLSAQEGADNIGFVRVLKDRTEVTFTNLSGDAAISKNGTLYANYAAGATATINGVAYTVVFDLPEKPAKVEVALIDNLKIDYATAEIDGTTITLTPNTGAEYVSFYCSLKDGTPVTFSELTGAAKTSSNGTLTARYYGTATATIGEDEYTIILDMPEKVVVEKTVAELIKTANADVTIDGTTITLAPVAEGKEVCFYPTLTNGSTVAFTDRTGGARLSGNGTLYAKKAGTAAVTINGTDYTIVFDIPAETKTVDEVIKTANATVEVEGTTITLTATNPNTQISLYPTTKDGKTATFSYRVGAKVSKNGTCYAKTNASCTMTIDDVDYTVNFVFA